MPLLKYVHSSLPGDLDSLSLEEMDNCIADGMMTNLVMLYQLGLE